MPSALRFGLLGTGSIAEEFADALDVSQHCEPAAVASRSAERAAAFAERHGVPVSYGSYDELLSDSAVDVIYVATPHPQHREWASKAAIAGKHVLCEKPLTVNALEAAAVIDIARGAGVLLHEAFAYRFHPQTHRLLELVRSGAVGEVMGIDVTFSYGAAPQHLTGRSVEHDLGGGGILDVGCYCVSMARLLAGAATGSYAIEPDEVLGAAILDPVEATDLYATAILRFEPGILAQLACGVALAKEDRIAVYGREGRIVISHPCWLSGRRTAASAIELIRSGKDATRIEIPGGEHIFALEADGVAELLLEDRGAWEASSNETLANMRTLDRWRSAAGVSYRFESEHVLRSTS